MTFAIKGEEGSIKMRMYANRGRGCHVMRKFAYNFFRIKYLVHKLLAIVTRFFITFIKISVLFKMPFLKNFFFYSFDS